MKYLSSFVASLRRHALHRYTLLALLLALVAGAGYWGWQWGPEVIVPYFVRLQVEYDDLFLDGEFNAPYIFFRFYAPDDCAKCRIGNTDAYDPRRRQLFALRPHNLSPSYRYDIKKTLHYPDGEVAFEIVEITGRTAP